MKKKILLGLSSCLILAACGGGGGGSNSSDAFNSVSDVNVARSSNGGTASSAYNPGTASNLIDGNAATTWISDPDEPIVVTFGAVENIKKIKLTRVAASATLGTNPDILIELSADGVAYTKSNVSVISGGIACTSQTTNNQVMECNMAERPTRYVRITTQNGLSFELAEFEAIARK